MTDRSPERRRDAGENAAGGPTNAVDEIRYAPRAVADDAWIEDFLRLRPMCVLALVDDGVPYLVNQLFVYDGDERAIFLHGANAGKTRTLVERDPPADASLTVSRMGRLLPAEKPVDFDVEYASVVVTGTIGLVEDPTRKRRALERVMEKFAPHLSPGDGYAPIASSSIDRTSVYRLDVAGWSGKRNDADADFPGAYEYDAGRDST